MLNSKADGNAGVVICGMFTLIIVVLFGVFVMFTKVITTEAESVQDDVTLSNLAVYKNVDLNYLAIDDRDLRIDPNAALETFKEHLKINMELDDNFNGLEGSVAVGKVTVNEFTIYNVNSNSVDIYKYTDSCRTFVHSTGIRNITKTSDNSVVKNTSVHATIEYKVNLIFGGSQMVTTSVDTDIVK
ncbi:hypothetical protein CUB90_01275 [Clostridium sp. CT7]|nr:hypothetical protein CUB90_01275 [Clostridium sp. CT7]